MKQMYQVKHFFIKLKTYLITNECRSRPNYWQFKLSFSTCSKLFACRWAKKYKWKKGFLTRRNIWMVLTSQLIIKKNISWSFSSFIIVIDSHIYSLWNKYFSNILLFWNTVTNNDSEKRLYITVSINNLAFNSQH